MLATKPQTNRPYSRYSSHLFVSVEEVLSDLRKLAINKTVSPEGISNKLLKEFAPIVRDIYNQSLREGFVPDPLKQSIVTPVPKVLPPPPLPLGYYIRLEAYLINQLLSKGN